MRNPQGKMTRQNESLLQINLADRNFIIVCVSN